MTSWEPARPAYFTIPIGAPKRERVAGWMTGLAVWAELRLRLTTMSHLHVGSGAPRLLQGGKLAGAQVGAARRQDGQLAHVPVVPGSSLKGALRVIAEALSPSCDPFAKRACRDGEVCPACLLFGSPGRRGLLAFTEAVPVHDARPEVIRIGQRYSHTKAPRRGRRLYGPDPEAPAPQATEAVEVVHSGTELVARLALHGAPEWAAGLVTIALGIGAEGLPHLRLGGGKNRGMGIVVVSCDGGWQAPTRLAALTDRAPVDDAVVAGWQRAALDRVPELAERRDQIATGYGGAR